MSGDLKSLSDGQRSEIMSVVQQQYLNAGVDVVTVREATLGDKFLGGRRSGQDATIIIKFTDKPHFARNKPDPDFQGDGTHRGYNAKVSLARAQGFEDPELINFAANTAAHESGHPLFKEKGKYLMDGQMGSDAEKGTIMEANVSPTRSGAALRQFSERDQQMLQELLNEEN